MSWSPAMRESRRERLAQQDLLDAPALAYKLVCDGRDPLTNAFVVTRKAHDCVRCERGIAAGERVRRETRRSGDGLRIETRYVCAACCDEINAMCEPK